MKAWRFYGFGDLRLDDVPPPTVRPGHVLVQPLCVQPSVTEAQLAQGIPTLAYDRVKRRLETEAPVQLFGHEFCARILEVGPNVTGFHPGDRVAARAKLPCGDCPLCRAGREALCRRGPVIGFDLPGCFSEVALLPEIALVKVDDRISDSEAACLQSLSDSVAAVETAGIQIGDTVAIFGQGSMGLECLQIARISGAGQLITVDVRDEACQVSHELGADHALNATACDPVAAIRELTSGNGADVVFECAGGSPKQGLAGTKTLGQAIDAVRSGGKLIGVSWFGGPLPMDVDLLRERSLRYLFPDISTLAHLEHTVRLTASGRVRLKPTIRHILHGIEAVPQTFEITAHKGKYQAINPAQVVLRAEGEGIPMLTGKMVRVRYHRDRIIPAYLTTHDDATLQLADGLIDLFRGNVGQTRGQVEDEVEELFGNLPQPLVVQGLAKLLEDRCDFEVLPGLAPDELREAVFRAATTQRQAGTFTREAVLAAIAQELNVEPARIETGLFADLKSEQRLVRFDETTAERLLERYNVALAQAILLRCTGVEIVVRGEPPTRHRQLLRAVKFHRLICDVERTGPDAYRFQLDGPLSLFSATQKYGLQLALFLPTLLLCRDFQLRAEVRWGAERKEKTFVLTPKDGLVSHQAETGSYVPAELGMFVELFRKRVSDWELREDAEIVLVGTRFWVPDFSLVHKATGTVVLLDVLGFWRKSSLDRHLELLRQVDRPFVLALADPLRVDEAVLQELPTHVVRFRNLPLAEEIAKQAALWL